MNVADRSESAMTGPEPRTAKPPTSAGARPPYAEMLRAVGAVLDQIGSQLAMVEVAPGGVRILAVGDCGEQRLSIRYLAECIEVQRQMRGHLPARDPLDLSRLSPVLRAVGMELDRQPPQRFRLAVTYGAVVVEGSRGYQRTLALDALTRLLAVALDRRTSPLSDHD